MLGSVTTVIILVVVTSSANVQIPLRGPRQFYYYSQVSPGSPQLLPVYQSFYPSSHLSNFSFKLPPVIHHPYPSYPTWDKINLPPLPPRDSGQISVPSVPSPFAGIHPCPFPGTMWCPPEQPIPIPTPKPPETIVSTIPTIPIIPQEQRECGRTNKDSFISSFMELKIIGGHPAPEGAFPWMANLMKSSCAPGLYCHPSLVRLFCGGTIINPTTILTAAHCMFKNGIRLSVSEFIVRVGEHNTDTSSEAQHVDIKPASYAVHPSYNALTNNADVAVIKLSSRIVYSATVQPICLSTRPSDSLPWTSVIVAGWGAINKESPPVSTPNMIHLYLDTLESCRAKVGAANPGLMSHITAGNLCAGTKARDACQGDSGGPMIVRAEGKYIQVGIVSWGFLCGSVEAPGIYANVYSYKDWIEKNMN